AQISGGIVGVRLRIHPALTDKRQGIQVTLVAADLVEEAFAEKNGALDGGITGNHAAGDGERGLEEGDGGEVSDGKFVDEAVAVGIGVEAKALLGLHAVMMIHGIVGELANGNHGAGLVIRKNEQSGGSCAAGFEAGKRQ